MAADVAPAAQQQPSSTPAVGTAPAPDASIDSVLGTTHGDPDALAARLLAMHRADDPEVWTAIHQRLGNAAAVQTRAAIDRQRASDVLEAPVERTVYGVAIVAAAGVRAAAVDECATFITAEVGPNEYAQQHLAAAKVAIVIIPAKVKMTDVPAFEHLRGGKTFDGRDWSTVRGSGGMATPDGRFAIAVAEESLVQVKDVVSAYPATYSVGMHEFAHVLESKGMSDVQRSRVKELYAAHKAKGTFTDDYAAANEQEYFAQSTNAFFDKNVMGKNHSGRAWLEANDPDMYQFLLALYTIHHDAKGAVRQ